MSRAATTHRVSNWSLDDVQHLVLDGVSWELYEHLLKEIGNRPIRLTYDNGELEIISPLPEHEIAKEAIADIVKAILEATDTPWLSLGSTTFRRRLKKKGLEPDSCFYIRNRIQIVGKKRINLPHDPPPDLAIDIDITSRSLARLPIYEALGVPELWRYDGRRLVCMRLTKSGYEESQTSPSFPSLRLSDLLPFIRIAEEEGDPMSAIKTFRAWLRKQSWAK